MTLPRRAWIVLLLVAAGLALVALDWPATLTDEDDYMPRSLEDLLATRNPYATEHAGQGVIERPWGTQAYEWATTLPYLPAAALLQIPLVDYRITALLAYAFLLLGLRDASPRAFYAFANPVVLWLAASGFNDLVPLALLAWARRVHAPILAGVASACKQLVLPLLVAEATVARDWRRLAVPALVAAAITLPFILWDPGAFFASAFLVHASKAPDLYVFWNYLLYPLYLIAHPPIRAPALAPPSGVTA